MGAILSTVQLQPIPTRIALKMNSGQWSIPKISDRYQNRKSNPDTTSKRCRSTKLVISHFLSFSHRRLWSSHLKSSTPPGMFIRILDRRHRTEEGSQAYFCLCANWLSSARSLADNWKHKSQFSWKDFLQNLVTGSVADPWPFGVNPDPRIHASDYWVRNRIRIQIIGRFFHQDFKIR